MEKRNRSLSRAVALAALVAAAPAACAATYWTDSSGAFIKSGSGDCVRALAGAQGCGTPEAASAPAKAVHPAKKAKTAPQPIGFDITLGFASGMSAVAVSDRAQLDAVADAVAHADEPLVQITGYTDRVGSVAANRALALRRAEAARRYLVAHGVPANIVLIDSVGESRPAADCRAEQGPALRACRATNRRAVVAFSGFQSN